MITERNVTLASCRGLRPRQQDLRFYTNTSPGNAIRVREASVF
jgi:hypothetical protein